ncbi:MAG: hypothetical protein WBX10_08430, partial [Candidatus Sulfotelmatobacter sp.]
SFQRSCQTLRRILATGSVSFNFLYPNRGILKMTTLQFDRINSCPEAGLPEMIGARIKPANGTFVPSRPMKKMLVSLAKQVT